ncbi:MAG: HAMP domain-containing sensor histidine kinase [Planctomycetota bacterium]
MTTESQSTTRTSPQNQTSASDEGRTHQGSLRSKLVLSLAAVFFLFLTIDELVRQKVIQPEFRSLEESGAIRDANRVLAALNAEVEHLAVLARHWGTQIREREAFTEKNEVPPKIQSPENLDWAATISGNGDWDWILHPHSDSSTNSDSSTSSGDRAESESPDRAEAHPQPIENDFRSLLDLCRNSGRSSSSGMTRIGSQSLVLFSLLELSVDEPESSNPSPFLLVARRVDGELIESLRRQTQVEFTLQSPRTGENDQKLVVWQANESTLVVEVQLVGLDNKQLANVYIEVPRDITARSQHTTQLARNSFIFGSVAALLILLLLLQKIVISPLSAIREHSDLVAEQGLNTKPLVLQGNDEIGDLASAFDKMVGRLSDTQTQLTQASQAAGRSQVASTVIHNVGNVLTNVNSLIDAACDRTDRLRINPLNRLASSMRSKDQDAAMLAATPDYLDGLAGSLQSDQRSIHDLLNTLSDNVRHIHDIIRAQREHTEQSLEICCIPLQEVIEEAISCCRARLEEDSIKVTLKGRAQVEIDCDRSLMLQTMINLIGNARHAMRIVDQPARELVIQVQIDTKRVSIAFRDNGCGMKPETIQRVFDAHFTTRESGTGLGLHFCAITLKRLGGSIAAASDGLGKGSVFTIEVPRTLACRNPSHRKNATGTST